MGPAHFRSGIFRAVMGDGGVFLCFLFVSCLFLSVLFLFWYEGGRAFIPLRFFCYRRHDTPLDFGHGGMNQCIRTRRYRIGVWISVSGHHSCVWTDTAHAPGRFFITPQADVFPPG
jgi:hypothetical protein